MFQSRRPNKPPLFSPLYVDEIFLENLDEVVRYVYCIWCYLLLFNLVHVIYWPLAHWNGQEALFQTWYQSHGNPSSPPAAATIAAAAVPLLLYPSRSAPGRAPPPSSRDAALRVALRAVLRAGSASPSVPGRRRVERRLHRPRIAGALRAGSRS